MDRIYSPPRPVAREAAQRCLTVTVLFTDVPHTVNALRTAAGLAADLNATLRILAPIVVPYPLALTDAPVRKGHFKRHLTAVANGARIPTRIDVVHCRDREQAICGYLEARSIVVVGWKKRWLFDRTAGLLKRLKTMGHHVLTAESTKGD